MTPTKKIQVTREVKIKIKVKETTLTLTVEEAEDLAQAIDQAIPEED
jgi:hypothetical protein